jgi:Tol biopolymer transport system component
MSVSIAVWETSFNPHRTLEISSRPDPAWDWSTRYSREMRGRWIAAIGLVACGGATEIVDSGALDVQGEQRAVDGASSDSGTDGAMDSSVAACDSTKPFGKPQVVTELMTMSGEGGAKLSTDGLTVYFTSTRNGPIDLFFATRASVGAMFGAAMIIPFVSGMAPRAYPTLTGDGLTIVYVSVGDGALMQSTRATTSVPFPTAQSVFNGSVDGFPHLVPDGSALYFSHRMMMGPARLNRSVKSGTYQPGAPIAGLDDNGQWVDLAPVVTPDERTIYFASNRPGSTGFIDVWVSRRKTKTDPFGMPALVSELSTPSYDIPTWISPDECEAWLMVGFNPFFDGGMDAPTISRAVRPQ